MRFEEGPEDERLARLLASVRADADPALWTRVRARVLAAERSPAWQAWLMRPAALGASVALLVVSMATAFALVAGTPSTTASGSEDLGDALVAELDQSFTETVAPGLVPATVESRAPRDSGGVR